MGILLEMIPTQLAEAVMSRLPDPKSNPAAYFETKDMILQLVEHKTEFLKPVPMDIGNVEGNGETEESASQSWGDELCSFGPKG